MENYERTETRLTHRIALPELVVESSINLPSAVRLSDPKSRWWQAYLGGTRPCATTTPPAPADSMKPLRAADLFCGAGGLALGVAQLAAEFGTRVITELVVDEDSEAASVYAANHDARIRCTKSVSVPNRLPRARTGMRCRVRLPTGDP